MKKTEIEDREKLSVLLKEAEDSPIMKTLRAEKAAEVLVERQEAKGKIAALRNEESRTIPGLQSALDAAEAEYLAAKKAQERLVEGCREATLALRSERLMFDSEIRAAEAWLIETAPAEIDEAINFFAGKLTWLRAPGRIVRVGRATERNLFTWTRTVKDENNEAAVLAAIRYCRDAVAELERMKLSPALEAEKIGVLKAGMPQIDEYAERQASIPMERGPMTPIPRFGAEALEAYKDACEQSAIDRLIKKANDLLRKPAIPTPAKKRAELGKRLVETRDTGAPK